MCEKINNFRKEQNLTAEYFAKERGYSNISNNKEKYILLLKLSKDLTDIEIEKVKDFVSSLKSQRIQ